MELLRDATLEDLEACTELDVAGELQALPAHYHGECAGTGGAGGAAAG